ncbi:6575_t:CDS:2 [Funneliformis caledonium]|uniref:6575_t:CDS:1 n=1 Tax=Funneliformis caledonium TaxID=1117310 RepID=A0A9N9FCW5_9GLOM|nr:6575_t:CDS:2 [Funneliformis caledonium]
MKREDFEECGFEFRLALNLIKLVRDIKDKNLDKPLIKHQGKRSLSPSAKLIDSKKKRIIGNSEKNFKKIITFANTDIKVDLDKEVIILSPLPRTESETHDNKFKHPYLITRNKKDVFDVKWVQPEHYADVTKREKVWCIIDGKSPRNTQRRSYNLIHIHTNNEKMNVSGISELTFISHPYTFCELKFASTIIGDKVFVKLKAYYKEETYKFVFASSSVPLLDDIEDNKYCKPVVKNFETIDAIYIGKKYDMTFQMTVGKSHDIKQHGYDLS